MKTAKWESSPGALASFLASKPQSAIVCDLYTFTFAGSINNGTPLYYTTADVNVKVPYIGGTIIYDSRSLYFDQINNKAYGDWKLGLDVGAWQVITAPTAAAKIGNQPWLSALRGGALDGAYVTIDRAFIDNRSGGFVYSDPVTPLGVVTIFAGRVAEIDFGRTNAVISINSHLELLQNNMPRNIYSAGCRWTLFDSNCALSAASYVKSGTVVAQSATNVFTGTIATPAGSGTYSLGYVIMTSGQNAGYQRGVRNWAPGSPSTFTLISPLPFPLSNGDTFEAYPGCDKTLTQGTLIYASYDASEPEVLVITQGDWSSIKIGAAISGGTLQSGTTVSAVNEVEIIVSQPFTGTTSGVGVPFNIAGTNFGCQAFNNQIHYGGEPFIPAPETAI